jgi:hypothetical protein
MGILALRGLMKGEGKVVNRMDFPSISLHKYFNAYYLVCRYLKIIYR